MNDGFYQDSILTLEKINNKNYFFNNLDYNNILVEAVNDLSAEVFKLFYYSTSLSDVVVVSNKFNLISKYLSSDELDFLTEEIIKNFWSRDRYDVAVIFLNQVKLQNSIRQDLLSKTNSQKQVLTLTSQEVSRRIEKSLVKVYSCNEKGLLLGWGSGFFVNNNGLIISNEHVIEGSAKIIIETYTGNLFVGTLKGDDAFRDLAAIKINLSNTSPVILGNSFKVENGQQVYAYGNPLGVNKIFTDGIISKKISLDMGIEFIQFTAPISPGNSGGMLVNNKGELVGIPSGALIDNLSQNNNYAIPINRAFSFLKQFDSSVKLDSFYSDDEFVSINSNLIETIKTFNSESNRIGFLDNSGNYIYGLEKANEFIYSGHFKNNDANGLGKLNTNSWSYIGEFKDDKKHGKGTYASYSRSVIYIGEFENDRFSGEGTMVDDNEKNSTYNQIYIGEFKNSMYNGSGTIFYTNNSVYSGSFKEGAFYGNGSYYYNNGRFEAKWADSCNAVGKYYFFGGTVEDKKLINCNWD